jgi:hypothetical protein
MTEDSRAGKEALGLRLVCPQLHNSAWKVFGQILGQASFQVCSRESITNLKAISTCRPLSPWIQKLTLGYYEAPCPVDEVLEELIGSHRGYSDEHPRVTENEKSCFQREPRPADCSEHGE